MKISHELRDDHQVELTIELDGDQVDKALHQASRSVSRRTRIPGFRPGKAPYRVVAAMVGRESLLEEALQQIGPDVYKQALEETGIEALVLPEFEVAEQQPVTLRAVVPLKPVVELGDYRSARVAQGQVSVGDDEIAEVLHALQEQTAQWVPVDRPAVMGDQVTLDVHVTPEGETVLEVPAETLVLAEELEDWPPGFAAEVTGLSEGSSSEFTLRYPSDYNDADLAGREALFSVTVQAVRERQVPELDDDFARSVGDEDTLQGLQARIRQQLLAQRQQEAGQAFVKQVLETVLADTTIKYPPVVVEAQVDDMMAAEERELARRNMSLDTYLTMLQTTRPAYRQQLWAAAENDVRRQLLLAEIVQREGIEVTDAELDEQVERLVQRARRQGDADSESLASEATRESLRSRMLRWKALDRLLTIARGEAA